MLTKEEKKCCRCNQVKTIDEFTWNNKAKGKRHAQCKECRKKHNNEYYYGRGGNIRHTQTYIKNRERRISYNKEYLKANGYAPRKYDPDKAPARIAVYRAIKKGEIIRPDKCDRCSKKCKPQAHHHNGYDKQHRLDVVWLCSGCHALVENPIFMKLMEDSNVSTNNSVG